MFGGALMAGLFIDIPGLAAPASTAREESELEQVDEKNFREMISAEHRLTVINMMMDGNPDAEKLQEILEQLQKEQTYGEKVAYAELDVIENTDLATSQKVDLEEFAGQLDFYAAGYKLGSLRGPADRPKVEATIERYLAGLVKRFGPGWLPEVDGMQRAASDAPILKVEPADAVPGMKPIPRKDTPPGMQPASQP